MIHSPPRAASLVVALSLTVSAPAVQVQFTQLDWLGDDGAVLHPSSRVGEAELFFGSSPTDQIFVLHGAFVNIVTQVPFPGSLPQWSVQNWLVQYPDAPHMIGSSPSVQFDLGNLSGQPVPFLSYVMSVTLMPLQEMPGPKGMLQATVQHQPYHVGGRAPLDGGSAGGSGLSAIPLTIGAFICIPPFVVDFPVSFGGISVATEGLRAVDEDINGCAPGSVARSLGYMLAGMGIFPGVCQDAYDELVDEMDTDTGRGGTGTTDPDMLAGKEAYTAAHTLAINSDLQYGMNEIGRVKAALNNGGDVEILIGWDGGGGHAAMITSVINLASGGAIITYVDDPDQGDGEAENEEHTIVVDGAGDFAGGTVDGFLVETAKNPADLSADGTVNGIDLAILLAYWGPCLNPPCGSDLNGDGVTNGLDLAMLLAAWG
jgi:Dockerin type I domain